MESLPAATILVYVDTEMLLERSGLSFSLPDEQSPFRYVADGQGVVHKSDVLQAVDTRDGRVVYQGSPRRPRKPKHHKIFPLKQGDVLVHNTYFENLAGIYELGLVPAKNPEPESQAAHTDALFTGTPPLAPRAALEDPGVVHCCLERDLEGDAHADGLERRAVAQPNHATPCASNP